MRKVAATLVAAAAAIQLVFGGVFSHAAQRFGNLRVVALRAPVVHREVSVVQRAGHRLTPAATFVLGMLEAVLNGEASQRV